MMNKKLKKGVGMILLGTIVISMTACGKKDTTDKKEKPTSSVASTTSSEEPSATPEVSANTQTEKKSDTKVTAKATNKTSSKKTNVKANAKSNEKKTNTKVDDEKDGFKFGEAKGCTGHFKCGNVSLHITNVSDDKNYIRFDFFYEDNNDKEGARGSAERDGLEGNGYSYCTKDNGEDEIIFFYFKDDNNINIKAERFDVDKQQLKSKNADLNGDYVRVGN